MRFGILVFPGSNCDHDCQYVIKEIFRQEASLIWHRDASLAGFDAIIIPGGFSYGDYLRTGAIARFSPVMSEVKRFSLDGGIVLGICNGFQILLEAGLLPGAMLRNRSLKFICRDVYVRVEDNKTPFTRFLRKGDVLKMPIAHAEGNYYADPDTLLRLKERGQIIFRYADESGGILDSANPNGAMDNIAGICNKERNILGMMPHPERCSEMALGNEDGKRIFRSVIEAVREGEYQIKFK
ncbi:MAG: phosphoribosylformylglycinamidine synthase subunit PurQ [Nitrospirae bacterium]|nr:phosphoribosylformylglycinamidine synthase subunit PurQ [Nitrospirota bacterium]